MPGKGVGKDIYTVFVAIVSSLHCDKEKVRDAEDHSHRPAPSQQAAHQAQAVQPHRSTSPFQGADELLVPESADEEGRVDAAGLWEVGAKAEHATEGFPQEPTSSEICHGVGQVHQVVGDKVGDSQVDEEDLVGADARFLRQQGAKCQPVVSQNPCQEHERSDDGFNQLFCIHRSTKSGVLIFNATADRSHRFKACNVGRLGPWTLKEEDKKPNPVTR